MPDLIERLRDNEHDTPSARAVMNEAAAEIGRLRGLLEHADKFVIWEETQVRDGFQEEIEAALGIV